MAFLSDMFLVAAALGATFYCFVLSRRLNKFTDLEKGVGGAIAALSAQVDDMTRTLKSAQGAASASATSLGALTGRAEDAARRLELLVASMHDLPPAPRSSGVPAKAPEPPETAADVQPASAETPAPPPAAKEPAAPAEAAYVPIPAFTSRRNAPAAAE